MQATQQQDDETVQRIAEERNKELRALEQEISDISEIMNVLAGMAEEQGEILDTGEQCLMRAAADVSAGLENLQRAETWATRARGLMIDASAIIVGATLGTLGFLAGPWVGVPTLVGGLATATSLVVVRRKKQK